MASKPKYPEISQHTIRLVVGLIALLLPILVSLLSEEALNEVSAAYHQPDWGVRDIFVGSLFAISSFLLAYNGCSIHELVASKVAAPAALMVAMVPCGCGFHHDKLVAGVHFTSAAIMFVAIAIFCWKFFERASDKAQEGEARAKLRARIYLVCGVIIVGSIVIMALDHIILNGLIESRIERFVYYGETAALVAFGFAWLVASRILPIVTDNESRIRLSPFEHRSECPEPDDLDSDD